MKKLKVSLAIFLLFFVCTLRVDASRTYTRGIVKTSSNILNQIGGSALKNDTGGTISLSSPEAVEVVGEEGNYYKIKFMYTGFIYAGYIHKNNITVSTYTTDDAYEQYLINSGFPSDYASKLAVLHAIHPNWNFTPSFTGGVVGGLDFGTVIRGEASVVSRNVINGSNTSLRSTADGAYKNGEWIPLAGNGWYAASEQTISFYMDPRNFLDESHIFMFENLGYNAVTQTNEAVTKVLSGTFMMNPFDCFEVSNQCSPGTHTFVDTFMTAGINRKVSPVHLASRVKQEQGTTGSVLSLGRGYNNQFIGYYNFFNIGASGKTDVDVIINGLTYAQNRNWNNQHISIYDGSSLIASNYVGRGQSTGYYQKFNTIAKPFYGNQYMQNVRAPYSEAYSTYTSYYRNHANLEEWDKEVYDFLIPVYANMGSMTTLDTSQNGDSTLKSLIVEGCDLNPSFQSSAYDYDCYVKKEIKSVAVFAEATSPNSRLMNPGNVNLTSDEQKISVVVTAANGTSSTYSIMVHKIETDGYTPVEILNGIGIKVSDNFISNLELGENVSNVINKVLNSYHFATIKVYEANGTEVTEGNLKTGQTVTIVNAGKSESFKTVLYGDTNGDGLIDIRDLLIIQKHLVKSKIINGEYLRASDLNKDGIVDIRDLLLEQKSLLGQYQIAQG